MSPGLRRPGLQFAAGPLRLVAVPKPGSLHPDGAGIRLPVRAPIRRYSRVKNLVSQHWSRSCASQRPSAHRAVTGVSLFSERAGSLCEVDTDPCAPNPCIHAGTCVPDASLLQGYRCLCPDGFIGTPRSISAPMFCLYFAASEPDHSTARLVLFLRSAEMFQFLRGLSCPWHSVHVHVSPASSSDKFPVSTTFIGLDAGLR